MVPRPCILVIREEILLPVILPLKLGRNTEEGNVVHGDQHPGAKVKRAESWWSEVGVNRAPTSLESQGRLPGRGGT